MPENIIRKARKEKNIPIDRLAELVGGSTGTLQRLETGATQPVHELLPALSEVLGVPMMELAGFEPHYAENEHTDIEIQKSDAIPYDQGKTSSYTPAKERGRESKIWRVQSNCLDAIGLEPGDLIKVLTTKESNPIMGDPVLIRLTTRAENKNTSGLFLLRQFIEPDLFITNSGTANSRIINRAIEGVEVLAIVESKILRHTA